MKKRPIKLSVRVNESEYVHLSTHAHLAGLSKEAFIRKAIMGIHIKPKPPEELHALLYQLSHIGNNINQIARISHITQSVHTDELLSIYAQLDEIQKAVKKL